ncbi:hypothetical protein P3T35_008038 [Kitasatospora sp. GP30]|jgi:hypothetical protein|uniref:hypothetical protein n=1 Tax=Kitasatospora sp. GP30 TaxID=3035084 RepID=UPI000C70DBC9|nr:hypothetical protein [Kitasatospora sp. GP30]MDH6145976.1 hypothetical protein [Kitasatospora sp. GP30]
MDRTQEQAAQPPTPAPSDPPTTSAAFNARTEMLRLALLAGSAAVLFILVCAVAALIGGAR